MSSTMNFEFGATYRQKTGIVPTLEQQAQEIDNLAIRRLAIRDR